MRPIELSRQEAEFIVDACERDGAQQWMDLAAQLREIWGMSPFPAGTVAPPAEPKG